jgi:hypothetical protein
VTAAALVPLAKKEFRALLPTWVAAAACLVLVDAAYRFIGVFTYAMGAFTLGAQSIGHEYGYRTLATLLVQPVDRRQLYAVKMAVLAAMLIGLAAIAATLGEVRTASWEYRLILLLPPLGGLLLAPWMTMVCRHPLAGAVFASAPAGVFFVLAELVGERVHAADRIAADRLARELWVAGMTVLGPVVAICGWRHFLRLQVIEGTGRAIRMPSLFDATPRPHPPLWALVKKELHLQQVSYIVAALHVAILAIVVTLESRELVIVPMTLIYFTALALVIGSLSSAEERQLGTLESQLLLPVPVWRQWSVKIGVALALSLLLGLALPAGLLRLVLTSDEWQQMAKFGNSVGLIVLLTTIALYVSSLSTSGVRALAMSFPATLMIAFAVQGADKLAASVNGWPPLFAGHGEWQRVVLAVSLTGVLLWLAYRNHRTVERRPRRVLQQASVIAAVVTIGVVLLAPL